MDAERTSACGLRRLVAALLLAALLPAASATANGTGDAGKPPSAEPPPVLTLDAFLERERSRPEAELPSAAFAPPLPDPTDFTPLPPAPGMTIIGGLPAQPGSLRDMVRLTMVLKHGASPAREATECSGVLIHPQLVLTAAHCLIPKDLNFYISDITVWYGHPRRDRQRALAMPRPASSMLIAERYRRLQPELGFDLGAIHLPQPLSGPNVAPARLAEGEMLARDRLHFFTAGWGKTVETDGGRLTSPQWLLYARLMLLDASERPVLPSQRDTWLQLLSQPLVSGGSGPDEPLSRACVGDSGGGFYAAPVREISPGIPEVSGPRLIGLTSFGRNADFSPGTGTSGDDPTFCLHPRTLSHFTNLLSYRAEIAGMASAFGIDPGEIGLATGTEQ